MKWLFALASFLLLALVPAATYGDNYCRSRAYYAPSYRAYTPYTPPTYYPPASVYTAPNYDYTPIYRETYLKTQLYPTTPDYYASTNDYYRDKVLLDAFAGKISEAFKKERELQEQASLKEQVANLQRQLLYFQSGGGQPQPLPQQQRQEQPQPPQQQQPPPEQQAAPEQRMPRATGRLPAVPPGLQAVVQSNCIRCHGDTYQKDGKGIDLRNLEAVPKELRLACKAAVDDKFMPYRGKGLSDENAGLFHLWATGRSGMVASK
jgi:hypothetical protein